MPINHDVEYWDKLEESKKDLVFFFEVFVDSLQEVIMDIVGDVNMLAKDIENDKKN